MRSLVPTVGWVCLAGPVKGELLIVFISFLALEICQPVLQHEAITLQTDEKMILTDQLVIEDRKGESADI